MALKDWILSIDSKKEGRVYRKRSDYTGLRIDWFKPQKYGYDVIIQEPNNRLILDKHFKTRSQALKFAKDYMKKH